MAVFSSCHTSPKSTDNSKYLDSVSQLVYSKYLSQPSVDVLSFADSAWRFVADPNELDLYKKYKVRSDIYFAERDYHRALVNIDTAIDFISAEQEKYKNQYANAIFFKGQLLFELNQYDQAYAQFFIGMQFVQDYLDTCSFVWYSQNLASVSYRQGKYSQAIQYYQDEYGQANYCKDDNYQWAFVERQGCLDNIGLCYYHLRKYDSAIVYYKKALDFIAKYGYKYPDKKAEIQICSAIVKGNLGTVYFKIGKLDEAELLLKEDIETNTIHGQLNESGRISLIKLARVYIKQGRQEEAYKVLCNSRRLLDSLSNMEELAWLNLASEYYDTVGDVQQAFKYYKSYIKQKEASDAARKELPGADFNKTFDYLRQSGQVATLKKAKYYGERLLIFSALLSVMAVIILYLLWRNYRLSKKNLNEQTELNKKIGAHNIAMQNTLSALEQSQQGSARMMKVIAHDLRSPIAAMVGLTNVLSIGDYNDSQKEMFKMLLFSGENALKLIAEILTTQPVMELEKLRLDELIGYSVGLMQFRATEKQQKLLLRTEPATIMADREKMWRVINNLIINAIKFSYTGKEIEISLENKGSVCVFCVSDKGVGIPAGLKNELFKNSSIAGKAGTSGEQSFGLGLSICKQIVELHGGRIWFESEEGKGTTFFVELKTEQ